jgi:hypothetical protein
MQRERGRARGASRPQSKRSKSDCLIQNGCDPWTVGVAPGRQSPRSPSLVCVQLAGPAHPPRPARATRQASLPTRPRWGHLLAADWCGAGSCRRSPPPRPHRAISACALGRRAHHRSSPDWRAPHRKPIHTLTHAHTPGYAHTYIRTHTHTHTLSLSLSLSKGASPP